MSPGLPITWIPAARETFTYDSLNRLYTAGTAATWGDIYGYDSRGNLLSKTVTRGSAESWSNAADSNNHMVGSPYDAAGNMNLYNTFNSENQWTHQSTYNISYLYDGDGQKVESSGGASGSRIYWYDKARARNHGVHAGRQRLSERVSVRG